MCYLAQIQATVHMQLLDFSEWNFFLGSLIIFILFLFFLKKVNLLLQSDGRAVPTKLF